MIQQKNDYKKPAVKVVDFMIEHGFEASTSYSVVQPSTNADGMVERMNYSEGENSLGWDWHIQ
jgi:hypothetical protein